MILFHTSGGSGGGGFTRPIPGDGVHTIGRLIHTIGRSESQKFNTYQIMAA